MNIVYAPVTILGTNYKCKLVITLTMFFTDETTNRKTIMIQDSVYQTRVLFLGTRS